MRQIEIFRFWLPLYASWLLMTAEAPLISAAVGRLPDEVVMLAAFGIAYSLAVLIESPVINLLATATALAGDRASVRQIRRFTVHWMLLLSTVAALLALTPLFDAVVVRAMAIPPEVARQVRPGLVILIPWSAAIAWRRFLQGVLIRHGRTRPLALGTVVRLAAVVVSAAALLGWGRLAGVEVAALALVAGVASEALYASLAVRPVLRRLAPRPASGEALTYRALAAYHLPLASTSVLTLLVNPMIGLALAHLARPTLSLAAWPLIFYLTLFMRAAALALPEVVIALGGAAGMERPLRRFSFTLAAMSLLAMLVLAATPLADVYLLRLQNTTPEIAELARLGLLLSVPLPAMVAVLSWLRGRLMLQRSTRVVNGGMAVRLAVFVPVLAAGVALGWPGVPAAVWAVNLSVAAELAYVATKLPSPSGSARG